MKITESVNDMSKGNREIEICDLGCGTGLVGVELQKAGYVNITGVDCSEGMLHEANKKGAYKKLHHFLLGQEDYIDTYP